MITFQSDVCAGRIIVALDGHSGAAPRGSDIVCAAASVLAFTLIEAFRRLDEEGGVENFSRCAESGCVRLDVTVKECAWESAQTVLNTVRDGFLLLEEHYPENVSVV